MRPGVLPDARRNSLTDRSDAAVNVARQLAEFIDDLPFGWRKPAVLRAV